jgi:hypothetical protein
VQQREEPNAQAIITHHHDRTRIEISCKIVKMVEDDRQLIFGGQRGARPKQDHRRRSPVQQGKERTEVRVARDDDSTLSCRKEQELVVSRPFEAQIECVDCIVAPRTE